MSLSLIQFKKAYLKWLENFLLAVMITQACEVKVYGVDIAGPRIFDANCCVECAEVDKGSVGTSTGEGDDGREHQVKRIHGKEVSHVPAVLRIFGKYPAAF